MEKNKEKIGFKKQTIIVISVISLIFITILISLGIYVKNLRKQVEKLDEKTAGMIVTMLGGSNEKDKGNINSCGYIVRTKNDELIIVDGGRDIDSSLVLEYIRRFGSGTVNHWFITHAHTDHVGALIKLLEEENIVIENIYYSFNSLEWYKKYDIRGYETEEKMFKELNNSKIKNKIECEKNQIIKIDNIECEILRIPNPEIIHSDNGNDSSMVFKFVATDVNKSILFLGDAYLYTSVELLKSPEKLKADAVQMSHHGQNGVTKEVYDAIRPALCFYNAPEFLYNNDNGTGFNTGNYQSVIVREWMKALYAKNIVAFNGDRTVRFTTKGIEY